MSASPGSFGIWRVDGITGFWELVGDQGPLVWQLELQVGRAAESPALPRGDVCAQGESGLEQETSAPYFPHLPREIAAFLLAALGMVVKPN